MLGRQISLSFLRFAAVVSCQQGNAPAVSIAQELLELPLTSASVYSRVYHHHDC